MEKTIKTIRNWKIILVAGKTNHRSLVFIKLEPLKLGDPDYPLFEKLCVKYNWPERLPKYLKKYCHTNRNLLKKIIDDTVTSLACCDGYSAQVRAFASC